jgi:hypothetical protein
MPHLWGASARTDLPPGGGVGWNAGAVRISHGFVRAVTCSRPPCPTFPCLAGGGLPPRISSLPNSLRSLQVRLSPRMTEGGGWCKRPERPRRCLCPGNAIAAASMISVQDPSPITPLEGDRSQLPPPNRPGEHVTRSTYSRRAARLPTASGASAQVDAGG